MTRKGKDFVNNEEWHNSKTYDYNTKVEKVLNKASDSNGDWSEQWDKVNLERWCEKTGRRGAHTWKEKWYKKVFALSKKKDELGREVDGYESDGSMVEECTCEKWGKNEEADEEWLEKWGEVHRPGEKQKWCDKWQLQISTNLKKGENWGQTYNDEYQMKEHWAEKWDQRHPENNGVYEKRFEKHI